MGITRPDIKRQPNGDSEWISRINRQERAMRARWLQGLKQTSIKASF